MDYTFKVGNDNGHSEQDIYIDGNFFAQPNVNVAVTASDVEGHEKQEPSAIMYGDILKHILVDISSPMVSGTYLIGESAIVTGKPLNQLHPKYTIKSDSTLPVINTLGVVASYAVKKHYEDKKEFPKSLKIGVDMTLSLPVNEYFRNKDSKTTFADNFINGPHYVTVRIGRLRVQVEVNFTSVICLAEAQAATWALIKDAENNYRTDSIFDDLKDKYEELKEINGQYFEKNKIFHIDIGDGSVDTPVTISVGMQESFINGMYNGAGYPIEKGLVDYQQQTGLFDTDRLELTRVIKTKGNGKRWKYDIAYNAIKPHLDVEVKVIYQNIEKELVKTKYEVDMIVVYGGGSILMRELLEPLLQSLADSKRVYLFYVPEQFAINMNADGLNVFAHSSAFERLNDLNKKKKKSDNKSVNTVEA